MHCISLLDGRCNSTSLFLLTILEDLQPPRLLCEMPHLLTPHAVLFHCAPAVTAGSDTPCSPGFLGELCLLLPTPASNGFCQCVNYCWV